MTKKILNEIVKEVKKEWKEKPASYNDYQCEWHDAGSDCKSFNIKQKPKRK